jgi:hypothetical protein
MFVLKKRAVPSRRYAADGFNAIIKDPPPSDVATLRRLNRTRKCDSGIRWQVAKAVELEAACLFSIH